MFVAINTILSLPNRFMILLIRFYQLAVSPALPKSCRFTPTCSTYALHALQRYQFPKAFFLSAWRVLRCNPFCKGGYDPLP